MGTTATSRRSPASITPPASPVICSTRSAESEVPYSKVEEHAFDNLIALCANCHSRVTKGQIDQKAVKQIKANLSILSHRYSELERRYLQNAAETSASAGTRTAMAGGLDLLMGGLLTDGMVIKADSEGAPSLGAIDGSVFPLVADYILTPKGQQFIQHWVTASPLD
jgi:hypothetical protein